MMYSNKNIFRSKKIRYSNLRNTAQSLLHLKTDKQMCFIENYPSPASTPGSPRADVQLVHTGVSISASLVWLASPICHPYLTSYDHLCPSRLYDHLCFSPPFDCHWPSLPSDHPCLIIYTSPIISSLLPLLFIHTPSIWSSPSPYPYPCMPPPPFDHLCCPTLSIHTCTAY